MIGVNSATTNHHRLANISKNVCVNVKGQTNIKYKQVSRKKFMNIMGTFSIIIKGFVAVVVVITAYRCRHY